MFCWNHMCATLSTLMLAVPSAWAEDDSYAPRSREQVSSMLRRSMGPGPSSGSVLSIYRRIARRYREIFRPPADYNGDGYADLAAAAVDGFATIDEEVNVYYGGPSGLAVVPDLVIPDPLPDDFEAFSDATFAGDVNGDGYGDLVVGANSAPGGGAVYVYFGRRSGLPATPDQVLRAADTGVQDTRAFGFRVERARDLDRDGYDDIIVSAIATSIEDVQDGVVFVYRGGLHGLDTTPSDTLFGSGGFLDNFGNSMCATFLNRDRYPDLIIAEQRNVLFGGGSPGRVHIYYGGPGPIGPSADLVLESPDGPFLGFGQSVSEVGDVNLDGYGDFMVGQPLVDGFTGRAFLYLGGRRGVRATPAVTFVPPAGNTGGYFGWEVGGGGDVDGNGIADVAIGETDASNLAGEAHVIFGPIWPGRQARTSTRTPDQTLTIDTGGTVAFFGQDVAFIGDVDGNQFDELFVGAPWLNDVDGGIYVYEGLRRRSLSNTPTLFLPATLTGGAFGISLGH